MPTEPSGSNFQNKIQQKAYPVHEAGGIVWAYLGPIEKIPPFPEFQWTKLPPSHRLVAKVWQECNYLQGIEGGIDSAHVGYLHRSLEDGEGLNEWGIRRSEIRIKDTSPELEVEYTKYGYRYAALRSASESEQYVRITPFIMPWYSYVLIGRRI